MLDSARANAAPLCLLALPILLSLGCGDAAAPEDAGGLPDVASDAGPDPDSGVPEDSGRSDSGIQVSFGCFLMDEPLEGGGATGGAIDGFTVIHVVDPAGRPVETAWLVLEDARDRWTTQVDDEGCVRFRITDLRGPTKVSAFSDGFIYQTIVGHDAQRRTIVLEPIESNPVPVRATVTGTVSGFEVLTASTSTSARVASARPILTDIFQVTVDQMRRLTTRLFPLNDAAIGGPDSDDFRDYTLFVDPRVTHGVWLNAGKSEFPAIGNRYFVPTHVGILHELQLRDGQTLRRNIEITLTRSERVTLTFGNVPAGLSRRRISGTINFPPGTGMFFIDTTDPLIAPSVTYDAPPLVDALAQATYGGTLRATNAEGTALSLVNRRGTSSPNVDLGDLPAPPSGLSLVGRSIDATIGPDVDQLAFVFLERPGNPTTPLWTVAVAAPSVQFPVELPSVPGGLEARLTGPVRAIVEGRQFEGAVDFNDLVLTEPLFPTAVTVSSTSAQL